MGLLLSCCCRKRRSAEREPLLPKHHAASAIESSRPSQAQLSKLADIVAAVKSGKLPSEEQVEQVLRRVLDSDVLSEGPYNYSYGSLSTSGREVVAGLKQVIDAVLLFGHEKNGDSTLQDLFFRCSQALEDDASLHAEINIHNRDADVPNIDTLVNEIPNSEELTNDTATLVRSVGTLTRVLLTSFAFRAILTDLVAVGRDVIGDAAVQVDQVAQVVESVAQTVGTAARNVEVVARPDTVSDTLEPDTKGVGPEPPSKDNLSSTSGTWERISEDVPERLKASVLDRLQEAVRQAQEDRASRRALITILKLLRKYAAKLKNTSVALSDTQVPTLTPVIWADPSLANVLSDLGILMSRMASNRPLEPLFHSLYASIRDIINIPANVTPDSLSHRKLQEFLDDLGAWFVSSLSNAQYTVSPEGRTELEVLYDRAFALVDEASRSQAGWIQNLRTLFLELAAFTTSFSNDNTSNRLLDALSSLSASLTTLTHTTAATVPAKLRASQRKVREDVKRDALGWFLPRLLRALHVIPMPRVEYSSSSLDAVVDAMYVTPSSAQVSLVPDHIRICNFSEVQLDVLETDNMPHQQPVIPFYTSSGMRTCTRLRVSVDGVRVSARDIGYYVSWRMFGSEWLSWLGYEDEGLVSLDIGGRGVHGDGLNFEFELEYYANSEDGPGLDSHTLFTVTQVHVTLRGLRLSLDKSKHWLLNKLVFQPFAAPIGRVAAGWVLRRQLQGMLEALGIAGAQIMKEAESGAEEAEREIEWSDYASAIWHAVTGDVTGSDDSEEEEDSDEGEDAPLIDTRTHATAKGVVIETATYTDEPNEPSSSDRVPVDESVLAVGIGEQILPGKGGPHADSGEDAYGPRDVAREGLDEIQSRMEDVTDAGHEALHQGTEMRRDVEHAAAREQDRERHERRKGGWRSSAFDF